MCLSMDLHMIATSSVATRGKDYCQLSISLGKWKGTHPSMYVRFHTWISACTFFLNENIPCSLAVCTTMNGRCHDMAPLPFPPSKPFL